MPLVLYTLGLGIRQGFYMQGLHKEFVEYALEMPQYV